MAHAPKRRTHLLFAIAIAITAALAVAPAHALVFDSGNLAVVRIDYDDADPSLAAPVYIDEYDPTTGSLVTTHALPSVGSTAFTLSGLIDHDGHLNLSADGRYLLIGGYRADAGASDPTAAAASDVNRVVARIDANWTADTSTALTDAFNSLRINAVASVDGESFWLAGDGAENELSGGLRYVANLGDSTSINVGMTQATGDSLDPDSLRNARIEDGVLYAMTASQGSYSNRGTYAVDFPTSGLGVFDPVIVNQEGTPSQYDLDGKGKSYPKTDTVFLDLDASIPGVDTAYGTGGKEIFEKWSLVETSPGVFEWVPLGVPPALAGSTGDPGDTFNIVIPDGEDILAMDAMIDLGGNVVLFLSTRVGIYRYVDDGGYNAAFNDIGGLSGYFIDVPDGEEFGGLVLLDAVASAVPTPSSLALASLLAAGVLRRRRRTAR